MARYSDNPIRSLLLAALVAMPVSFAGNTFASEASPLMIDGNPVDTSCLMTLANGDSSKLDPIDLNHCRRSDIAITRGPTDPRMTGFEYRERAPGTEPSQPYFFYRFLGAYHGHALLFIESDSGGSGRFTQLVGIDREGHTLKVAEEVAGGDRCNGSLFFASVTQGHLTYDQRITPSDLIALVGAGLNLEAGLESSAISCVAVVHRRDRQWTSVTLSDPVLSDRPGWTEEFRYQACFNHLYRGYIARGEAELDRQHVAKFANEFENACAHVH